MKEIEDFKKQNGNVVYTVKELIGGLHVKIDNIDKRLNDGDKKFVAIETVANTNKKAIYSLYGVLGTLLVGLLINFLI